MWLRPRRRHFELGVDPLRVLLDTSRLHGAASLRGIGRYVAAVLDYASLLGIDVIPGRLGTAYIPLDLRRIMTLAWLTKRERVDVFHAPTPFEALPVGPPQVTSILDTIPLDLDAYRRFGLRTRAAFAVASRSAGIVTLSDYCRSRIASHLSIDEGRIIVAPLPVANSLRSQAAREQSELRAAVRKSGYVLGFVDFRNPDPRKRYEWYLAVAERIRPLALELLIVGPPASTPLLAQFSSLPNVILVGEVNDRALARLYANAALLCYPSAYEGQGMPILEATFFGTPVLAYRNTAIPEVLRSFGWMLSEHEPDPFRAAVEPHFPSDVGALLLSNTCADILTSGEHITLRRKLDWGSSQTGFQPADFGSKLSAAYHRALEGAQ